MARARLLKPGFFANDQLAEVSLAGRLLFAGLWTVADRAGRLEDRVKRIKAEVLPYDDVDVDELLDDLAGHGFIVRYEVGGKRLIQIVSFAKHQSPHPKEAESLLPPYVEPVVCNGLDSVLPPASPVISGASPAVPIAGSSDPVAVAVSGPSPRPAAIAASRSRKEPIREMTTEELSTLRAEYPDFDVPSELDNCRNIRTWQFSYVAEYSALRNRLRLKREERERTTQRGGNGHGKPRVHPDTNDPEQYAREVAAVLSHAARQ